MNIYVETNFVLELVFEQEQCVICEQILQFCETGQAKLIIPAYSLAEPHEKLSRQAIISPVPKLILAPSYLLLSNSQVGSRNLIHASCAAINFCFLY